MSGRVSREGWETRSSWQPNLEWTCRTAKGRSAVTPLTSALPVRPAWRDLMSLALISITSIVLTPVSPLKSRFGSLSILFFSIFIFTFVMYLPHPIPIYSLHLYCFTTITIACLGGPETLSCLCRGILIYYCLGTKCFSLKIKSCDAGQITDFMTTCTFFLLVYCKIRSGSLKSWLRRAKLNTLVYPRPQLQQSEEHTKFIQ